MRSINLILATVLLCSCSGHHHLALEKKKKLVSELFSPAPQCDVFRHQLFSDQTDDDGIDDVYHAAQRAHCINKDI